MANQFSGNYGFQFTEKEEFIKGVTEGLPKPPQYFFHDSKLNQAGPPLNYEELIKKANHPLTLEEFKTL